MRCLPRMPQAGGIWSSKVAELTGVFNKPFAEQVAFFRNKLGNLVPTNRWDDLWKQQHDTAFMVAGAKKADLLSALAASIDKAISEGKSINEFRKDFRHAVEVTGWKGWTGEGSAAGEAWRTRVIYQTNMRTSYAAGRHAQLQEGGFEYWVYHHSDAVRNPRMHHVAFDGLVLRADDPLWDTIYPPNGWGCQCYVSGARSERAAIRQGGSPEKTVPGSVYEIDAKAGEPVGISKGWGYAPGASVVNTVQALSKKIPSLPSQLGAEYWAQAMPASIQQAHQSAWQQFFTTAVKERARPQGREFVLGAIAPTSLDKIKNAHPEWVPSTAEIVMRDRDVAHLLRDKKQHQLSPEWLAGLPARLRRPDAVLLDKTSTKPDLLYVFHVDGGARLIFKLDYKLKGKQVNLLRSGSVLDDRSMQAVSGQVKSGGYELLEGSL